jgi:hypothetical protein
MSAQIVVRLNPTERAALERTMARLRERDPRLTLSSVVRALLAKLDEGSVTI